MTGSGDSKPVHANSTPRIRQTVGLALRRARLIPFLVWRRTSLTPTPTPDASSEQVHLFRERSLAAARFNAIVVSSRTNHVHAGGDDIPDGEKGGGR